MTCRCGEIEQPETLPADFTRTPWNSDTPWTIHRSRTIPSSLFFLSTCANFSSRTGLNLPRLDLIQNDKICSYIGNVITIVYNSESKTCGGQVKAGLHGVEGIDYSGKPWLACHLNSPCPAQPLGHLFKFYAAPRLQMQEERGTRRPTSVKSRALRGQWIT